VLASVITLLTLPAIWLVNRNEDGSSSSRPNVAAVGIDPGEADQSNPAGAGADFDPMGNVGAAYLQPMSTAQPPASVSVAIGTSSDKVVAAARGTYRLNAIASHECRFNGMPGGEQITVVNVANGRSIECTTSPLSSGESGLLVMSRSRFQQIAELTAAPIHVEIRQ
jgi:hypothetical protein